MIRINKTNFEWHLDKLDQAASGIMGVGMVMEAIMCEENNEDSQFPYKLNGFVGGALVSAIIALANEVGNRHGNLQEMIEAAE